MILEYPGEFRTVWKIFYSIPLFNKSQNISHVLGESPKLCEIPYLGLAMIRDFRLKFAPISPKPLMSQVRPEIPSWYSNFVLKRAPISVARAGAVYDPSDHPSP